MSLRDAQTRRGLPAAMGVMAPVDRHFRRTDARAGRPSRTRQILWRARWAIIAVVIAGTAGGWAARTVLHSPSLLVRNVVVSGNSRLSGPEVAALVDGIRSENILRIDLARYRARVLDSPWIKSVTLWRVLPSTVQIQVVERRPIAIARHEDLLYLVDDTGTIIDEFGPQYRRLDLPFVDGLIDAGGQRTAPIDDGRLRLTEEFLAAVDAAPELKSRISQIDVTDARDVVALVDNDPALLHLGDSRFVERLHLYLVLAPTLREKLKDIDYVDLRFDEKVFVKSRKAAASIATGRSRGSE